MAQLIGIQIDKPASGRRLVIPDVHGCYHSLLALMEKIQVGPEDQLFFLGDYVNKGPHNRKVWSMFLHYNSSTSNCICSGATMSRCISTA